MRRGAGTHDADGGGSKPRERSARRLDTPAKVSGEAIFSIDVKRPDMLHGAFRLAPIFAVEVAVILLDNGAHAAAYIAVDAPRQMTRLVEQDEYASGQAEQTA